MGIQIYLILPVSIDVRGLNQDIYFTSNSMLIENRSIELFGLLQQTSYSLLLRL